MFTFDPDARRARVVLPGGAPIHGQLVCYYPCPRCSNPARALVYLPDMVGVASEVVAQAADAARHLGLLAVDLGVSEVVRRGVLYLAATQCQNGSWDEPHFTGTGFPGDFFINYDLYRDYFPLMALGRYLTLLRGG